MIIFSSIFFVSFAYSKDFIKNCFLLKSSQRSILELCLKFLPFLEALGHRFSLRPLQEDVMIVEASWIELEVLAEVDLSIKLLAQARKCEAFVDSAGLEILSGVIAPSRCCPSVIRAGLLSSGLSEINRVCKSTLDHAAPLWLCDLVCD